MSQMNFKYFGHSGSVLVSLVLVAGTTNFAIADSRTYFVESWQDLVEVVNDANDEGSALVRATPRSVFTVDEPLPVISGDIVIEGNGVTFESAPEYQGALTQIAPLGSLSLEDIFITGFVRHSLQGPINYPSLIDNNGSLKLNRVTVALNSSCLPCTESLSLLDNRGEAFLNNVTLYRNFTISPSPTSSIRNCGYMQILNSTFAENEANQAVGISGVVRPAPAAIQATIPGSCESGSFEIGNSLFANAFGNCGELSELSDLGGNFDSNNSCGFDPAHNTVGLSAGLGRFGLQGGLVPTLGLESRSRAIDIGSNVVCSATDARLAARPTQAHFEIAPTCDAGAFEYGGGFGNATLLGNGMNGIWYNAATDGHYVHILRVSPNRIYVNWSTFDQSANQLWVFGVAESTGDSSFAATAYINSGGRLNPGGAPDGHVVQEWGSFELEFYDCLEGVLRYHAHDADFGDGQFKLDRLAFDEGVGCLDLETD